MKKLIKKIKESPINYFSDLFIVAMVMMWIIDNVYESIIATVVTISSVIISHQVGYASYDTSMWSSIGNNIVIPLSAGGAMWLIKCAVQHAIKNFHNKEVPEDFPDTETGDIENEEEM